MKQLKAILKIEEEINKLDEIECLLDWDKATICPRSSINQLSNNIDYISSIRYDIINNKKYKQFINKIWKNKKDLPKKFQRIIDIRHREIIDLSKYSEEFLNKKAKNQTNGLITWELARNKNDFKLFEPALKKMISDLHKEAKLSKKEIYKHCLEQSGTDLDIETIEEIFMSLKEDLISLKNKIKNKKTNIWTNTHFPIDQQRKLSKILLQAIGVDTSECILGDTIHPFQTTITSNDRRIGMSYKSDDLLFGISSVLHEGGHCMYEQNLSKAVLGTCLKEVDMIRHESQSRFYETVIGMGYSFWKDFFSELHFIFPDQFKNVSLDKFYNYMNYIEPSLIRISSDEITYCLHIIIRFEIEKDLLRGKIKVEDLPKEWNKKYQKYLGIKPTNLKNGVLQDIHWADGTFGYFPSYALGNIIAGMLHKKLEPLIVKNNLIEIKSFLKNNIHKHGAIYTLEETIKNIFKKDLDYKDYINYLENKHVK